MIRKLLLLVCALFFTGIAAQAQHWGWDHEEEGVKFAYTLQYYSSQYKVFKQKDWQMPFYDESGQVTTGLNAITADLNPGFGVGLALLTNVHKQVELRLSPTFVLNDRVLTYRFQETGGFVPPAYEIKKKVRATLIDLPLAVKLRSDRRKNFAMYLLAGSKYSINLNSAGNGEDAEKVAFEKLVRNKKAFFSYEAGLGIDFHFEHFKLSPELKYASSFNSVLEQQNTAFSRPIDKLMLRNITFSLYIQ
ncbi:outer membrane beta-barrel protein [Pedobacter sp.]|uniref:type IX secretion/gliding motility protein PorT/SprT n=1 Tax=Pedobacter sp. TaxID=1411316 RepID=UPI003D7F53A7